ncbi:hypothetical protein WMY93_032042 [Mugilogobius chulae]|uniref:Uncharacterized protein n=1 Tax=Mugilogobius chulae TaxID=88201 RepID=A0AAW0MKD6_9GOBI
MCSGRNSPGASHIHLSAGSVIFGAVGETLPGVWGAGCGSCRVLGGWVSPCPRCEGEDTGGGGSAFVLAPQISANPEQPRIKGPGASPGAVTPRQRRGKAPRKELLSRRETTRGPRGEPGPEPGPKTSQTPRSRLPSHVEKMWCFNPKKRWFLTVTGDATSLADVVAKVCVVRRQGGHLGAVRKQPHVEAAFGHKSTKRAF